ncbi:MAG TPA: PadR family transcriptional regulator [Ktedonobacteraceae bacterium]|jgi:DNA-binding PadR family transcriptional regulator|nr:PadR family transcriptional regulator [Ktedonobacteraceae bacterium]
MERPEAYPITYGILGLLAFWGPMSGYDIKRMFDHTLSAMWGAAHSQIYKELRRMQDLGWVDMRREEQESRPDRKVYSITEKGREALREWHAQPPEVFQIRDELLLKVLFGSFASPEDLAQNLRAAIANHEMRLQQYRQISHYLPIQGSLPAANKRPNPYAMESEEDPYFGLITHFAIEFEKTYLRWLYEALEYVEAQGYNERTEEEKH